MEFQPDSNDTFNPQKWVNAPTLRNLKQELEDADSAHGTQSTKIKNWLDNLHVRNAAVPEAVEGHSQFQPKLTSFAGRI